MAIPSQQTAIQTAIYDVFGGLQDKLPPTDINCTPPNMNAQYCTNIVVEEQYSLYKEKGQKYYQKEPIIDDTKPINYLAINNIENRTEMLVISDGYTYVKTMESVSWYYPDFSYRTSLYIDNTETGYTTPNYQYRLRIYDISDTPPINDPDGYIQIDFTQFLKADRTDIRFVSSDGVELKYFIQFNKNEYLWENRITIWVVLDILKGLTNNVIYMYWGYANASDNQVTGKTIFEYFTDFSYDVIAAGEFTKPYYMACDTTARKLYPTHYYFYAENYNLYGNVETPFDPQNHNNGYRLDYKYRHPGYYPYSYNNKHYGYFTLMVDSYGKIGLHTYGASNDTNNYTIFFITTSEEEIFYSTIEQVDYIYEISHFFPSPNTARSIGKQSCANKLSTYTSIANSKLASYDSGAVLSKVSFCLEWNQICTLSSSYYNLSIQDYFLVKKHRMYMDTECPLTQGNIESKSDTVNNFVQLQPYPEAKKSGGSTESQDLAYIRFASRDIEDETSSVVMNGKMMIVANDDAQPRVYRGDGMYMYTGMYDVNAVSPNPKYDNYTAFTTLNWLKLWKGRILGLCKNVSSLYYSNPYCFQADCDWRDSNNNPNNEPINPNDGDIVMGMELLFDDIIFVYKKRGIYNISGDTPTEWVITKLEVDEGCIASKSIAGNFFLSASGIRKVVTAGQILESSPVLYQVRDIQTPVVTENIKLTSDDNTQIDWTKVEKLAIGIVYDEFYWLSLPTTESNKWITVKYHIETGQISYITDINAVCFVKNMRDLYGGNIDGRIVQYNTGETKQVIEEIEETAINYTDYTEISYWDAHTDVAQKVSFATYREVTKIQFNFKYLVGTIEISAKIYADNQNQPGTIIYDLGTLIMSKEKSQYIWSLPINNSLQTFWIRLTCTPPATTRIYFYKDVQQRYGTEKTKKWNGTMWEILSYNIPLKVKILTTDYTEQEIPSQYLSGKIHFGMPYQDKRVSQIRVNHHAKGTFNYYIDGTQKISEPFDCTDEVIQEEVYDLEGEKGTGRYHEVEFKDLQIPSAGYESRIDNMSIEYTILRQQKGG